jgi:hypothetical protein
MHAIGFRHHYFDLITAIRVRDLVSTTGTRSCYPEPFADLSQFRQNAATISPISTSSIRIRQR